MGCDKVGGGAAAKGAASARAGAGAAVRRVAGAAGGDGLQGDHRAARQPAHARRALLLHRAAPSRPPLPNTPPPSPLCAVLCAEGAAWEWEERGMLERVGERRAAEGWGGAGDGGAEQDPQREPLPPPRRRQKHLHTSDPPPQTRARTHTRTHAARGREDVEESVGCG
eukprot:567982-Rhodomonas_salina.1